MGGPTACLGLIWSQSSSGTGKPIKAQHLSWIWCTTVFYVFSGNAGTLNWYLKYIQVCCNILCGFGEGVKNIRFGPRALICFGFLVASHLQQKARVPRKHVRCIWHGWEQRVNIQSLILLKKKTKNKRLAGKHLKGEIRTKKGTQNVYVQFCACEKSLADDVANCEQHLPSWFHSILPFYKYFLTLRENSHVCSVGGLTKRALSGE